ncbi:MAG: AAA family ATPase [Candidatus Thiodiazotropha endolucinida]
MSRYCGEKQVEPILKAAEHWKSVGLLSEGSVFNKGSIWTSEYLESLDHHFINQPDAGEGNFYEKLEAQLEPTGVGVKQLAAEMLWLMLLCPSNIGESKKREGIECIWEWSGEAFPEDSEWIKDDVLGGVGSAGTSFNTNRWRELVFFIRAMIAFKRLTDQERKNLLSDGWAFAQWLEQVPECDARQLRHMFLFLLFPGDFERIFGGTDRRRIVRTFSGKSAAQVRNLSALEIDRNLLEIRKQKEEEYGTKELDFYVTPLRDLWGDARVRSWLFSWNPSNWEWESIANDRDATHEGKTVTHRWGCANQDASTGDKAFLVRTGEPPKGIIAIGNVVSDPYEAPHWDEAKAEQGKLYRYVDVAFSRIQDPLQNDPYITEADLERITVDKQEWSPQASGIEIKQRSAGILEKVWEKVVEAAKQPDDKKRSGSVKVALNQILYGPPGTGKTYQLNRLVEKYSSRKQTLSRDSWLIQELLDARWFDVIFGAMYDLGGEGKVNAILNHEYVQMKAKAMGRDRNIAQTIWATLQAHTRENSSTVQYKNRSAPLVFDKKPNSLWSLVDDWEEECAEQIEQAKKWKAGPKQEASHQRYEYVTFHQAYSYEDFVEGIRPIQDEETGDIDYQVVPGVFKRICQRAKADPDQRYAIFIDEINRGNIAKIFGELITLVEEDKRAIYNDAGDLKSGMELTLPYSGTRFGVPENLDVYGTMNTADRSIALLDTALRRRFQFKELMPDAGVISGSRGDGYIEDGDGGVINLRVLLEAMNRRIRFLLNRDMTLGHAYFINVRDFGGLKEVLFNKIIPLLQEYFYEDWHRIQLVFRDVGPGGEKLEPQIVCHDTLNEEDVLGFDHDDFEDLTEYWIVDPDEITPDAVRKVYEESA